MAPSTRSNKGIWRCGEVRCFRMVRRQVYPTAKEAEMVSIGQVLEFLTGLAKKVAWGKIDGAALQSYIDGIERTGPEFEKFVQNGCRLTLVVRPGSWPVWRKLTIGGKSTAELLEALKAAGCMVSDWARDIMGKEAFTTLPSPQEIQLVRVKVSDLGFNDPKKLPTTTEVFARAEEFGLNLCPAEVGPHLSLALTDQPVVDFFWVVMKQIVGSGGFPDVFCVERAEDVRWLRADCADPERQWSLGREVVFSLGKPQQQSEARCGAQ